MKIGVFDSGVGGQSFVTSLEQRFPEAEIVYKEDKDNVPYGTKSAEELLRLTTPIFKEFEDGGCCVVLVACNSLTTNCIVDLRELIGIPLVGVEPMIKPAAAMTQSGVVAVCATPSTLMSKRYAELKDRYAHKIVVVEPDCSTWAYMIEHNKQNELQLEKMVSELRKKAVDVIVLGCTHYHWIEEELTEFAHPIKVIQPTEPVLDQLEQVIADLGSSIT